ncbi:MAG: hypothetical protein A07HR67_00693 [uncultured archaeon A07HR67]|jgi:hypothetical protein|nr:MAG: hypothetical protein A07HR67_00693 [uncultured archaeon A07HR67]
MPHLQFEVTEPLAATELQSFAAWVTDHYAEVMDTGTGHVGVTVRDEAHLALGRAGPEEPVALLNADIRAGRALDQRREFAVAVLGEMADRWGVPTGNAYVVYTEHPGEDFHLQEGALDSWADEEADDGPV